MIKERVSRVDSNESLKLSNIVSLAGGIPGSNESSEITVVHSELIEDEKFGIIFKTSYGSSLYQKQYFVFPSRAEILRFIDTFPDPMTLQQLIIVEKLCQIPYDDVIGLVGCLMDAPPIESILDSHGIKVVKQDAEKLKLFSQIFYIFDHHCLLDSLHQNCYMMMKKTKGLFQRCERYSGEIVINLSEKSLSTWTRSADGGFVISNQIKIQLFPTNAYQKRDLNQSLDVIRQVFDQLIHCDHNETELVVILTPVNKVKHLIMAEIDPLFFMFYLIENKD